MLCKSYAASLMQIQKTQVCLGNNVVKFQLEQAKKELEKRILEKSEYEKEIKNRNQLVTLIDNVEWKAERYNFNSSTELSEENRNLGKLSAQIEELKNSPEMLAAAKEYDLAKSNYDEAYKFDIDLADKRGSVRNDIENTNNKISERIEQSQKYESEYNELSSKYNELIDEMKDEYERASKQRNTFIVIGSKRLQEIGTPFMQTKFNREESEDINNPKKKNFDYVKGVYVPGLRNLKGRVSNYSLVDGCY